MNKMFFCVIRDVSTANLQFLSSRQALADLAHFRTVTAATRGLTKSKWVAFGGSYPGSLAAWFRLKYPHLVHAAVATSAPVHATVNFPGDLMHTQSLWFVQNNKAHEPLKASNMMFFHSVFLTIYLLLSLPLSFLPSPFLSLFNSLPEDNSWMSPWQQNSFEHWTCADLHTHSSWSPVGGYYVCMGHI